VLVDRDKAIEACAKAADKEPNKYAAAAAIRQLTLEDCRVETPRTDALKIPSEALFLLGNKGVPQKIVEAILTLGDFARQLERENAALSAQVAAITKERDQFLRELEEAESDIAGYWLTQKQRAEAAEAQVAELQHDISRQMAIATEHVNRAEAAEAQVAGLRRELDEVQKECDGMRAIGLVDWKGRAEAAEAQVAELRKLYEELLYAVACKFPGETRHQTALRYINNAETVSVSSVCDAAKESG